MKVLELVQSLLERPQGLDVIIDVGGRYVDLTDDRIGIDRLPSTGTDDDDFVVVIRASYGHINGG